MEYFNEIEWLNSKLSLQVIFIKKLLHDKLLNRKKKWEKLFNSFEISKNIIYNSQDGRLLIGQNDSLGVLLLDEIFFHWIR